MKRTKTIIGATLLAAAALTACGGPDPSTAAAYAGQFYETAPLGVDLTCEGMAQDMSTLAEWWSADDAAYVGQKITDRAAAEGCELG